MNFLGMHVMSSETTVGKFFLPNPNCRGGQPERSNKRWMESVNEPPLNSKTVV